MTLTVRIEALIVFYSFVLLIKKNELLLIIDIKIVEKTRKLKLIFLFLNNFSNINEINKAIIGK